MFAKLIGRTIEVYVDNMFVKSLKADDHVMYLNETFQILRKYRMRLNPFKYEFGITSGKFVGYMVNQRSIDANLEKM